MKLFTLIILFLVITSNKLWAQDFEVSPIKLSFNAEPGESQTRNIQIKNHSNKNATFNIKISDFSPTSDGKKKFLPPNSIKSSIANWLTINPSFMEIKPNEELQVTISIQAPSDDFSSKWGILTVSPVTERTTFNVDKDLGAGITLSPLIAVLVYQSPPSSATNIVKITNLIEITKETDTERKFSATVENLGDRINECKVYLITGNLVNAEEKIYPPISIEAFPQTSRSVELKLPNGLVPGKYALSAIVDFGSKTALEGTQIMIEVK